MAFPACKRRKENSYWRLWFFWVPLGFFLVVTRGKKTRYWQDFERKFLCKGKSCEKEDANWKCFDKLRRDFKFIGIMSSLKTFQKEIIQEATVEWLLINNLGNQSFLLEVKLQGLREIRVVVVVFFLLVEAEDRGQKFVIWFLTFFIIKRSLVGVKSVFTLNLLSFKLQSTKSFKLKSPQMNIFFPRFLRWSATRSWAAENR